MKTYEELSSEILTKAKAERKARKKKFIAAGSTLSGLCLILAVSLVAVHIGGSMAPSHTVAGSVSVAEISAADGYGEIYEKLEINRESVFDKIFGKLFSGNNKDASNELGNELYQTGITSDESADGTAGDFSDTNIQVEGIMEADVVKTDGEYIYVISGDKLYIVSAEDGMLDTVSETDFFNEKAYYEEASEGKADDYYAVYDLAYPTDTVCNPDMYLSGDRVIIIYDVFLYGYYGRSAYAVIYDVTDRAAPQLTVTLGVSGSKLSSRMNGDILYLMTRDIFDDDEITRSKPETFIPSVSVDGEAENFDAADIYCGTDKSCCEYLNVCAIDISAGEITSRLSLLGYGYAQFYQSAGYLYAARLIPDIHDGGKIRNGSEIAKISLGETIEFTAAAEVAGTVHNSFSMDEYGGYFRLVTTVNELYVEVDTVNGTESAENSSHNNLYILAPDMSVAGKIEDLAPGERIYSARFDGDIAYFVTYRQTDPLFCADLSDPANPVILSELKIPGFSEYLHKFSDGLLLGIGKHDNGFLKLSMFNTSDKTAVYEEAKEIIRGEYYSEASYDHHAVLVDSEKNLIAFPGSYNYFVYSYTDGAFNRLAALPLYEYSYYTRGLYIGEYLYVCTPGRITSYSLDGFAHCDSVTFDVQE